MALALGPSLGIRASISPSVTWVEPTLRTTLSVESAADAFALAEGVDGCSSVTGAVEDCCAPVATANTTIARHVAHRLFLACFLRFSIRSPLGSTSQQ